MAIPINDQFGRRNNIQVPLTAPEDVQVDFLSVPDISSRDNISAFRRRPLMVVRVKDDGLGDTKFYELQPDLTTWTEDSAFGSGSFIETSEKGAASGVAPLNANGKIDEQYLNSLFINSTTSAADISAMLALTSAEGDVFVVGDASADPNVVSGSAVYYKINNDDPADLADFLRLDFGAQVLSINGETGVVTVTITGLIDDDLTGFNNRVANSSFGTTTTATIAQNTIDIATNAADILSLSASIEDEITLFDSAVGYSVGDIVYAQDGANERELFISILDNSATSVSPYDGTGSTYWARFGNYYTKDEITSLLSSKADLVGGFLDSSQVPTNILDTSDLETTLTDDASKVASSKGARDYADSAANAAESAAIGYADSTFDTSAEVDSKISSAVGQASQGISGEFADLTARDAASNITNGERWSVLSEGEVYEFTGALGQSGSSFWDFVYTLGSGGSSQAIANSYVNWADLLSDQSNQSSGFIYVAVDASGFSTVSSGYAYFEYLGTTNANESDYRKLSEEESLDTVSAEWGNITGTLSDQTDLQDELDDKADKATGHTTGNLAELDASGNPTDSGIDGDPIDLYDVPSDVKTYLENNANWTGGTLTVTGFAENGDKGQRYTSTVTGYTYEVVDEPSVWARYPLNLDTVDIITMSNTDKTKLETSGNWNGVEWRTASNGGEDLNTDSTGMIHYDGTYFYWVISNNFAIRLTRA